MFEGISIEEFYMLYKVGEAAGAVSVPFCILSFFSGATVVGLFITIVAGCKEDEAFVALKVGEKAANSETAQRLIDVAISKLEEKENK